MTQKSTEWRRSLGTSAVFSPQEEPLPTSRGDHQLTIGIPRERSLQENRLCLTPSSVALLIDAGHRLCIESEAGEAAKYEDNEYRQAGAQIVHSSAEAMSADILLKVEPPTPKEVSQMKHGSMLISALQVGYQSERYITSLNQKKITALSFELFRDEKGLHSIQRAMGEIAGSMLLFIAAEYLSTTSGGTGLVLGGIPGLPPSCIVLLGSGTVAESAARVALGLGANIHIFDNEIDRLRRLRRALGQAVYTSVIDHDTLACSMQQADVLIGAIRPNPAQRRFFVTDEMVRGMKKGSVIIDVSIDQGGCIDTSESTTHTSPIFHKHGVIHYCVPNITSRAARTATMALSNILTPVLLRMGEAGGVQGLMRQHRMLLSGIYTHQGYLTNLDLAKRFNIDYKDLNLLLF